MEITVKDLTIYSLLFQLYLFIFFFKVNGHRERMYGDKKPEERKNEEKIDCRLIRIHCPWKSNHPCCERFRINK